MANVNTAENENLLGKRSTTTSTPAMSSATTSNSNVVPERAANDSSPRKRQRPQQPASQPKRFKGCSRVDEYEKSYVVGEGTFGEVHKARCKTTGDTVALKRVRTENEKEGVPITALREIKILKSLRHQNIVNVVDIAIKRGNPASKESGSIYMVFPYMEHDLTGLLENPNVRFSEAELKSYAKQLLEGIYNLHKNDIIHRDIKGANLLINNRGVLKIADFGLARRIEEESDRPLTNCVVTMWYRPPELLLGSTRYKSSVDMWGIGCVIGEMFKKKPILPGNSDLDQIDRILTLCGPPDDHNWPEWRSFPGSERIRTNRYRKRMIRERFAMFNPQLVDLIDELLQLNPNKRLAAHEALDHDWFWTEPLPAQPSAMQRFHDESHELDSRRRRERRPAPADHPPQMAARQNDPSRPANPAHPGRPNNPPHDIPVPKARNAPESQCLPSKADKGPESKDGQSHRDAHARDRASGAFQASSAHKQTQASPRKDNAVREHARDRSSPSSQDKVANKSESCVVEPSRDQQRDRRPGKHCSGKEPERVKVSHSQEDESQKSPGRPSSERSEQRPLGNRAKAEDHLRERPPDSKQARLPASEGDPEKKREQVSSIGRDLEKPEEKPSPTGRDTKKRRSPPLEREPDRRRERFSPRHHGRGHVRDRSPVRERERDRDRERHWEKGKVQCSEHNVRHDRRKRAGDSWEANSEAGGERERGLDYGDRGGMGGSRPFGRWSERSHIGRLGQVERRDFGGGSFHPRGRASNGGRPSSGPVGGLPPNGATGNAVFGALGPPHARHGHPHWAGPYASGLEASSIPYYYPTQAASTAPLTFSNAATSFALAPQAGPYHYQTSIISALGHTHPTPHPGIPPRPPRGPSHNWSFVRRRGGPRPAAPRAPHSGSPPKPPGSSE